MRLKSPPIARASVLMAIVLARPGTPSTSRCPRARRATIIRSSRWSWPTMTFLTSYSKRSIGTVALALGSRSTGIRSPSLRSVRRQAGGPAGDVDGHGQADPDEDVFLGRIDESRDDADDLAVAVEERPAGVPGVDRSIHLDETVQHQRAVRELERTAEARHDARTHRAGQAEWIADDVGLAADLRG